jgi:hypothetical protein
MRSSGKRRLLVLGGTPNTIRELRAQVGDAGEVGSVSAGQNHSARNAAEYESWADIIVVWASTPADHKVTNLYRNSAKTLTVAQRGVASLARAVTERLAKS